MNLVKIMKDDVFTDSLVIAQETENQHRVIKQLVRTYEKQFRELGKVDISNVTLKTRGGDQESTLYRLNEPQATFLITLLRNTDKVLAFKLKLVKEFYRMRLILCQKQTSEWQVTREQGKLTRRDETDAIQQLVLLAQNQGSENSDKLYMAYTKLVNKTVGLSKGERETASYKDLMLVAMLEDMISNTIQEEVLNDTYYKTIYQKCKEKVNQFAKLAYIEPKQLSA